ncbi:hypothetical protein EC973_008792 [Apophysomyces ossiformis]|uniref:F-box domain-containing protein n=1 Tax=Apophysomyces ossiformis TaxID=679940 RepID=A0A8H7EU88_9FUNG|nr:hypothetical protein EC973_008792 [Apophysomyces ossiformis]
MTHGLPYEILAIIAADLPSEDQINCLHVSRSWKTAFMRAIYRIVHIHSRHQFRLFYRTLKESESRHCLGNEVRELYISSMVGFCRDEFETLPRLCPLLTVLDFNKKLWNHLRISTAMENWKHLKYLPQMPLYRQTPLREYLLNTFGTCFTKLRMDIFRYRQWKDLLQRLPHLEQLIIENRGSEEDEGYETMSYPHITLAEMEDIHATLPVLQAFALWGVYLGGELPKHITPSRSIRRLDIETVYEQLPMTLPYFSQKYTFIEELQIEVGLEHDASFEEFQDVVEPQFLSWMEKCNSLRVFYHPPSLIDGDILLPQVEALDTLSEIGAPITKLFIYDEICYSVLASSGVFSETLCAAELQLLNWISLEDTLDALSGCSCLAHLMVDVFDNVDIGSVLRHCRSLKTLYIETHDIHDSSDGTSLAGHGLENLSLEAEYIDPNVFDCLSSSCPQLRVLRCSYNEINAPRAVFISLPNAKLEDLVVVSRSNIVLFNLQQTDKAERVLRRREKYYGEALEPENNGWSRWYHATSQFGQLKKFMRLDDIEDVASEIFNGRQKDVILVQCRSTRTFELITTYDKLISMRKRLNTRFNVFERKNLLE